MAEKKMTKAEVLAKAKEMALAPFAEILEEIGAEIVKDYVFAVPVEVNGAERWVEFTLTAKDMMTDENGDKVPYDPFIVQATYQAEKEIKAAEKAERERKHADAVKKAEEKRAQAKAKAQAKKSAMEKAKAKLTESGEVEEDTAE